MIQHLYYEQYKEDELDTEKVEKIRKRKNRNRAILDEDASANRNYRPNKIKVIKKDI